MNRDSVRDAAVPIASVAVFAALWQVVGSAGISPAVPPLTDVLAAMVDVAQDPRFQEAAANTALAVLVCFVPVVVIGVVIGVAMGTNRWAEWIATPYLSLSLSIPLVSLIPVFLLIFGLGGGTVIAVIVAYSLPAVIVNTQAGIESVSKDQLDMARSVGASRLLTFRRITLPSASSLILAGVRVAAGRSIKGAIIAEQVIGLIGVGGIIQIYGGAFAVEELYAVILFIGIVGILVVRLLGLTERRLVAHR
jgi:ABC-type nitrate/sulfonate/bicarbonate transport system permease component